LEVLPTFTTAALGLAVLVQKTESAGAAVNLLVQVLETDPYELEALALLGRVLLDDGRTPEALEARERGLRFDPEHQPALFQRGVARAPACPVPRGGPPCPGAPLRRRGRRLGAGHPARSGQRARDGGAGPGAV